MAVLDLLRTGWPVSIELAETMPGPAAIVWALITDWENQGDWMLEVSEVAVTSPRREGIGVEAQAKVSIGGITTVDRVRVVAWEVERHLGIEHKGWVRGRGDIFLAAVGEDRTDLLWRERLYPPLGVAGTIGLVACRPLMTRIFKRDLRVLAGLVRARAGAADSSR